MSFLQVKQTDNTANKILQKCHHYLYFSMDLEAEEDLLQDAKSDEAFTL